MLTAGPSTGGTNGSVVNHVAFRVQSFAKVEEAGFTVQRLAQFPGVGSINTPEGERIELFENSATNLTFTVDSGQTDPVADRHNHPLPIPVAFHHVHLYVPQGADVTAKAWYVQMFGGVPGKRSNYQAVDLPGINLNFSGQATAQAPTRGRMLDHIGFEVTNLEAFCKQLEAAASSSMRRTRKARRRRDGASDRPVGHRHRADRRLEPPEGSAPIRPGRLFDRRVKRGHRRCSQSS